MAIDQHGPRVTAAPRGGGGVKVDWTVYDDNGWAVAHVLYEWLAAQLARQIGGTYRHR